MNLIADVLVEHAEIRLLNRVRADLCLQFSIFPTGKDIYHFFKISFFIFPNKVAVKSKDHHHIEEINDNHFIWFIFKDFEELNGRNKRIQNKLILNAALVVNRVEIFLDIGQHHFKRKHVLLLHTLFSGGHVPVAEGVRVGRVHVVATEEHDGAVVLVQVALQWDVRVEGGVELRVQAEDELFAEEVGTVHGRDWVDLEEELHSHNEQHIRFIDHQESRL